MPPPRRWCAKQVPFSWHPREGSLCCFLDLDLEIPKGIGIFVNSNNSQEFLQVLLFEILLSKILKIPLWETNLGFNDDVLLLGWDGDCGPEVTSLVVNLDLLGKEGLEVLQDDDVVLDWETAVNDELSDGLLALLGDLLVRDLLDHFQNVFTLYLIE